jgi:hypothetical protein
MLCKMGGFFGFVWIISRPVLGFLETGYPVIFIFLFFFSDSFLYWEILFLFWDILFFYVINFFIHIIYLFYFI